MTTTTRSTEWALDIADRIAKRYDGVAGGPALSSQQMRVLDECAQYTIRPTQIALEESGHMVIREIYLGRSGSVEVDRADRVVSEW